MAKHPEDRTPAPNFNVNRKPSGGGRQGPATVKGNDHATAKGGKRGSMPRTLKH